MSIGPVCQEDERSLGHEYNPHSHIAYIHAGMCRGKDPLFVMTRTLFWAMPVHMTSPPPPSGYVRS